MEDLDLGAQRRLYGVGKVLKHWCESVGSPIHHCPLIGEQAACNQGCPLYKLGDKLIGESGYVEGACPWSASG